MNNLNVPYVGKATLLTVVVPRTMHRAALQYLTTGQTPCSMVSESLTSTSASLVMLETSTGAKALDGIQARLDMLRSYVSQYSYHPVIAFIQPVNYI